MMAGLGLPTDIDDRGMDLNRGYSDVGAWPTTLDRRLSVRKGVA